jgi:23S rRNA (cytosine1962-C5)-methyltransferase
MVVAVLEPDGQAASPRAGDTVFVKDLHSAQHGWAVYHPESRIRARVFSRSGEDCIWEGATAVRLVNEAIARRRRQPGVLSRWKGEGGWRLCFGEADFLPGLVMDVFGPMLVVQINSVAGEKVAVEAACGAARNLGTIHRIVLRRDSPVRELEGLPVLEAPAELTDQNPGDPWRRTAESPVQDQDPIPVVMDSGEVLLADVVSGQKTGLFLDQRHNRLTLASSWKDASVLDMHCHVGGWALSALAQGAKSAVGVDSSAAAIFLARQAAALPANEPFGRHAQFEKGDDLEWMRRAVEDGRSFDVIVLDPPALAKAVRHVPGALRTHTALARQGLKLLRPGGILVQCCCSQAITQDQLEESILQAAAREGVSLHIVQRLFQPPDHPVLAGHPASEYLKGVVVRRV